jgi:hypothetical protein
MTRAKNGRIKALAVDHNHATGEIRGLLCANCNKGIGNLGDSPDRLLVAAGYLLQYTTTRDADALPVESLGSPNEEVI